MNRHLSETNDSVPREWLKFQIFYPLLEFLFETYEITICGAIVHLYTYHLEYFCIVKEQYKKVSWLPEKQGDEGKDLSNSEESIPGPSRWKIHSLTMQTANRRHQSHISLFLKDNNGQRVSSQLTIAP